MCEFCVKHGEGKKWYEVVQNYSKELYYQDSREEYIRHFFENVQRDVALQGGKLSRAKIKTPTAYRFLRKMVTRRLKINHFGQVVPLEDAERIVDMVQSITRTPCVCRSATRGRKDARYCLLLAVDTAGIFGDYPALKDSLETLTPRETKKLLRDFDKQGLIHSIWTFKTPFIGGICNCDHDCLAYRLQVTGDLAQTMFRAEYVADIEPLTCSGCRTCQKLCQFGAVEYSRMDKKCRVNRFKCYGCGICRSGCKETAITLLDRGKMPELSEVW